MSRLNLLNTAFFIILSSSCITLKDSVVNEEKYLGNKEFKSEIYSTKGNGTFLNPFNINTNNWGTGIVDRLMLAEFKPLEGYRSIELQIINNNGKEGALVILYLDGKKRADIYHTPEIKPNKKMYTNTLNSTTITQSDIVYNFTEDNGLLKVKLHFTDRFGNNISMVVDEQNAKMKPCGLLAPIGGMAKKPEFMAIVYMNHFRFLSQDEKNIRISINDVQAQLTKLPVKINGIKGYQTKYSIDPVTISWNKNTNEDIDLITPENNLFSTENHKIVLYENNGHFEIEKFIGIQQDHWIQFSFSPAIPDLQCLSDGIGKIGKFSITVDQTEGIIAGIYAVEKKKDKVILTIKPMKGYSPVPGKAWMKKMTWIAEICSEGNKYHINSKWKKNNTIDIANVNL